MSRIMDISAVNASIRACRLAGVEPVRIRAFAAPYSVTNRYGESLAPRALGGSVNWPLPMLFNHDEQLPVAGAWLDIAENDLGIWAIGIITQPFAAKSIDRTLETFPEVSVSYDEVTGVDAVNHRRQNRERISQGLPPLVAEPHMIAKLYEISLVDVGAYPWTKWWKV